jgi:hypothetical protein
MDLSLLGGIEKAQITVKDKPNAQGVSDEIGVITVQFNPSTLRIESNANAYKIKGMLANLSDLPNQLDRQASIVLSTDLIFDTVQNADAFHGDALRLSSQDIISQAASAAYGAGKKGAATSYTVLPQTSLMIAILLNCYPVTFNWGRQAFSGVFTEMQAKYLMFSPAGHPIRSKVSIRIQQHLAAKTDSAHWEKAYDNLFNNGEVRASHEKSALQQQSFLNLSGY